jgi:hypothetical protein
MLGEAWLAQHDAVFFRLIAFEVGHKGVEPDGEHCLILSHLLYTKNMTTIVINLQEAVSILAALEITPEEWRSAMFIDGNEYSHFACYEGKEPVPLPPSHLIMIPGYPDIAIPRTINKADSSQSVRWRFPTWGMFGIRVISGHKHTAKDLGVGKTTACTVTQVCVRS